MSSALKICFILFNPIVSIIKFSEEIFNFTSEVKLYSKFSIKINILDKHEITKVIIYIRKIYKIKDIKEKSEYIKITIEEEIKKIQQKLVILKQSIVDITNSTKIYKETIKQYRYAIYKVRPIPIPDWQESFEMNAVLSDM